MIAILYFALAACKGSAPATDKPTDQPAASAPAAPPAPPPSAPTAAPSASGAALPPVLAEFESIFLPIYKEPEGDARDKHFCTASNDLRLKAIAVRRSEPPAGVSREDWSSNAEELSSAVQALGTACADDPPSHGKEIADSYQAYRALLKQVSK